MYMFLQDKGSTSSIATKVFPSVTIPGVSSIPVLGQILSGHNVLTYVAFLMVAVVWVLLFRTRLGAISGRWEKIPARLPAWESMWSEPRISPCC